MYDAPTIKSYRLLHSQVTARPGAAQRLARLRKLTLVEMMEYKFQQALCRSPEAGSDYRGPVGVCRDRTQIRHHRTPQGRGVLVGANHGEGWLLLKQVGLVAANVVQVFPRSSFSTSASKAALPSGVSRESPLPGPVLEMLWSVHSASNTAPASSMARGPIHHRPGA